MDKLGLRHSATLFAKHSPKGKTSSLKKISRLRYASASIFSAALVATASTLIPALR